MRRLLRSQEIDAFEFTEDMGSHTSVIPYWFIEAITNGKLGTKDNKTCIRLQDDTLVPIPDHSWVFIINGAISFMDERTLKLLTYPPLGGA